MGNPEFRAWPKTARLFRDIVVTEKIDGSNGAIIIQEGIPEDHETDWLHVCFHEGSYKIAAQSRNRVLTPENDNAGFAAWVLRNAGSLITTLGVGYHYGEWWGGNIQRGYGLDKEDKRFSLFNVERWTDVDLSSVPGLSVVPVLYSGIFSQEEIELCLERLRSRSVASPEFLRAEGVVVHHVDSGTSFKITLDNDGVPKSKVQRLLKRNS